MNSLDTKLSELLSSKILSLFLMRILPLMLLAISAFLFNTNPLEFNEFSKEMGSLTLMLLLFIVLIKPISVFLPNMKSLQVGKRLRKEFGLLSFYTALLHGVGYMIAKPSLLGEMANVQGYVFWGTLAFIGMVLLGVTSNKFSIQKMGPWWHRLHKLIFPILVFVLIHMALVEQEVGPLSLIVVIAIAKFFEYRKVNGAKKKDKI